MDDESPVIVRIPWRAVAVPLGAGLVALGLGVLYLAAGMVPGAVALLGCALVLLGGVAGYAWRRRVVVDERGVQRRGAVRIVGPPTVAAALRERAGAPEPPRDAAPVGEGDRTLRPSPGALRWVLPMLGVSVALVLAPTFYGGLGKVTLVMTGLLLAALNVPALLVVLGGWTRVGSFGVRNRLFLVARELPWAEVGKVRVVRMPSGRRVELVRGRRSVRLAAPSERMFRRDPDFDARVAELIELADVGSLRKVERGRSSLGMALPLVVPVVAGLVLFGFERPQYESWWPGVDMAVDVPESCDGTDEAAVRALLPDPVPLLRYADGSPFGDVVTCGWKQRGGADRVRVSYELFPRESTASAADQAAERFRRAARGGRPIALGAGDAAAVDTGDGVRLWVRRANVIVDVRYEGGRPEARAVVEDLARRAVRRVELE